MSDSVFANGSRIPIRIERAKLNRRLIGWYVEFWKKNRRKLELEPMFVLAMLKSALLKLPLVASAGLSLRVAQPGHPKLGHQCRLLEERYLLGSNVQIQVGDQHLAERISVRPHVVNGVTWSVNCTDPSYRISVNVLMSCVFSVYAVACVL